ncbi:MAG: hypothetical protein JWO82_2065 [Akkermansiaceae bacterium]|nr:hypothetical protein [Akkermansiaceae bacterium]
MKTRPSPRPGHGFTLIELLVVISIIAVLAALALTGANMAMTRAKVLAAKTDESAIQRAIDAYVAEYAKLPAFSRDEIDTASAEGRELISILQGTEKSGSGAQNPRRVVFLSMREGKANANGMIYDKSGEVAGIYDPWGNPFHIVLDTDQDGEIPDPLHNGNAPIRHQNSAVYTVGYDKKPDTQDDVKTW